MLRQKLVIHTNTKTQFNGQCPPSFTEKVAIYGLKLEGKIVYINPKTFDEGTEINPCNY